MLIKKQILNFQISVLLFPGFVFSYGVMQATLPSFQFLSTVTRLS
jgi:hypothetical protein